MHAVRGHFGHTVQETTPRREVQRADRVEKVRSAAPVEALSETEVEQLTAYYSSTLQDLSFCFPRSPEKAELRDKLLVRPRDNSTAREVKQGYRQLLDELSRDSSTACKMVDKLGPGTHTLSSGDVVEISQDDSGNVEVFTQSQDGSTKRVFYNSENPKDVRVQNTSPNLEIRETERKGQSLTETRFFRERTSYSLEEDRLVRQQSGPAQDDLTQTTVNPDGSTETRELIYFSDEPGPDGGVGVYDESHQPARSIGTGASGGTLPHSLGEDKRPPYILGGAVGGAVSSSLGGIALDGQVGGGVGPRPSGLGTDKRPPYILGDAVGGPVGHSVGGAAKGGQVGGGAGGAAMGGPVGGGAGGAAMGGQVGGGTRGTAMGGPVGHSVGGTVTGGQAGDRVGGVADEVPPATSAE